jgi:hypothetical protein
MKNGASEEKEMTFILTQQTTNLTKIPVKQITKWQQS